MTSFNIAMWGTFGGAYTFILAYRLVLGPSANYTSASMYAMSRKVLGYNTWFSED